MQIFGELEESVRAANNVTVRLVRLPDDGDDEGDHHKKYEFFFGTLS